VWRSTPTPYFFEKMAKLQRSLTDNNRSYNRLPLPGDGGLANDVSLYVAQEDLSSGGSGTDDQVASEVQFTPAGTLASTNVQAALQEVDTEKQQDIQFKVNGVDLGTSGIVNVVDIVGSVTGSYASNTATYTFSGASVIQENVSITGGNAGSFLRVTASATGTTCSFSSGAYTVTIPAGAYLFAAQLVCVTADIQTAGDGGGFTDWITVRFVNTDGNNGITTLRVPQVQKVSIPTANPLSASNSASIDTDNNPFLSVIGATGNSITIRMSGSNIGAQGYLLAFSGF